MRVGLKNYSFTFVLSKLIDTPVKFKFKFKRHIRSVGQWELEHRPRPESLTARQGGEVVVGTHSLKSVFSPQFCSHGSERDKKLAFQLG